MTRDDWAKLVAKVLYSADDPDEGEYAVADAILSALSDASPASEHADASRLPQDGSTPPPPPTLPDLEGVKEALHNALEMNNDSRNFGFVDKYIRAALQALEAKNV